MSAPSQGTPVSNLDEFIRKWGTCGWELALSEFIQRSPEFKGDSELAKVLGEFTADLQTALSRYQKEGR